MTSREMWRKRMSGASLGGLCKARGVYTNYINLYELYPELCSKSMHENALTALREIDAAIRRLP